ncbi:DUF2631 domain-containing protein [Segniliparus rugosus]|uniref:DUF2631 domain-containing protein n=1 Tax=Segniliparus rugosus (strain ATCC BAA-974 / DSM 45345 / CCUG 50838 / CIP 108380 / JCM 13579 / CDC 945) TaxID=679197 RepID=E5XL33_SEGRC|nr:DUF2631 domain-containing protein [Segniliparus rugosus]EFV14901.1 hypothetical protein HMPREF9336_00202 [Segniliparus rugosus ATCC BAA-974]
MSQTEAPALPAHHDEHAPHPAQARWYEAPKVDLAEEPSGQWGWHGEYPNAYRWIALATIASLLVMLIGNHKGHVEDVWLIAFAAITALWLVVDIVSKRGRWKR